MVMKSEGQLGWYRCQSSGDLRIIASSSPGMGSVRWIRLMKWNTVAKAGSMVGSGAVVVCAEGTCMLDMALNAVKFYRNESCGKCVPCRVGSQKMVDMLTGWTQGKYRESDMGLLTELSNAMRLTSICGLGQIVPAPIQSVIEHFRDEVDAHIVHKRCPADVCLRAGAA